MVDGLLFTWTYSLWFMSGDKEIRGLGFGDDDTIYYGPYTDACRRFFESSFPGGNCSYFDPDTSFT